MARYRFYLVSAFLFCCLALGQGGSITTSKPVTVPLPTSPAAPDTTTEEPTTTAAPITTPAPTTTTPAPTTTTPAPTTTTPAPTTTSSTPPPTTAAPPTPAPAPTPLPPAEQGTWWWSKDNTTCVLVQFAARLNVTYSSTTGNTTKLAHALLNVPASAQVVAGACDADNGTTQWLQLSWPNTTWANNLTLQFSLNATTHQYALEYLNVTLTPDAYFPNASSNATIELWHASDEWWTPVTSSYRCTPPSQLTMSETDGAVATLTLSRLQEEAFRKSSGTTFSSARECGGGDVPDAVPIAVGCALGGLVVVVLVAYLVGRRRSAARGYLSM